MISVSEAKKLINNYCNSSKEVMVTLLEANGCVLSENVLSKIDTPPFNQSAMDGYAYSFADRDGTNVLIVSGEIQAGIHFADQLKPKEAVRIYTGAKLPPGIDTVVMQEKVIRNGDVITLSDEHSAKGSNVRLQGSQTKRGEVALKQGQLITPAGISFLAGIGNTKVKVFSKPTVSIIVTGNELTKAGEDIIEGRIFESNSVGIVAALNKIGISPVSVELVDDEEDEIRDAISGQLQNDILILTGGVSVGDYDLVPAALEQCGVKKIFHKVKQKPGKPFYFGIHAQTLVFALPGNPASVMSCFYQYVVPAVSCFTKIEYFKKLRLPLTNDFRKKSGLTFFLKGKTGDHNVTILKNQESYMMNSFAEADCLVELDEETEYLSKGDLVYITMII